MAIQVRLRLLIWLSLAVAAAASTACFEMSEVAVENLTTEPLTAGFALQCDRPRVHAGSRITETAPPSGRSVVFTFSGRFFDEGCVFVTTDDARQLATAPVKFKGRYEATREGDALRLTLAGGYGESRSFDFTPGWLLYLLAIPFGLGGAVALFIAARFFFRFYVQGIH